MPVLFTTFAAAGHFHPLVPLAQALREAGHEAAFAGPGSLAPTVEGLGFPHFAAGYDPAEGISAEVQAFWDEAKPRRPGPASGAFAGLDLMELYWKRLTAGYMARRMVPDLMPLLRQWRPQVVVRGLYEVGGAIAAEAVGLPHATVQIGHLVDGPWLRRAASTELDPIRRTVGLPPDPKAAMLYRHLLLSFVPPSYQEPDVVIPTQHHFRTVVFDRPGAETAPAWLRPDLPRPVIYATFGTMAQFNTFPALFQTAIAGLHGMAGTLIVTVGRDQDPAVLGSQPAHVHVERYVPQSVIFPHADLVVHHGGHNTTLAALAEGLPQVIIPLGADQPANARRCEELDLGIPLWPAARTPAAIAAAARTALADPRFRRNAARLQAEMMALPGPEHAVTFVEDLVRSHRSPAATASPGKFTPTGGGQRLVSPRRERPLSARMSRVYRSLALR
jgi:UDP:flavonoid glycosyltransferase YjiC (YdhE family)